MDRMSLMALRSARRARAGISLAAVLLLTSTSVGQPGKASDSIPYTGTRNPLGAGTVRTGEPSGGSPEGPGCLACEGIVEPEACGQDVNGGCNVTPQVFTVAACADVICGTVFAAQNTRDTDWYVITVPPVDATGNTYLTISLRSEVPCVALLFNNLCPSGEDIVGVESFQCIEGTVATCLPANATYIVFVAPGTLTGGGLFSGFPCNIATGNDYRLELTCAPCPPPPPGCMECPPPPVIIEPETCGASANGGCGDPPAFVQLACGDQVCGTLWALAGNSDQDWYRITVPDQGGSGISGVTLSLTAELPVVARLFNNCSTFQEFAALDTGDDCMEAMQTVCIPSGEYLIQVAIGTLDEYIFVDYPCAANNSYVLGVTCAPCPCTPVTNCCRGDVNNDGELDGEDVSGFVAALLAPPNCGTAEFCRADVDGNTLLNFNDVDDFVQSVLDGGACTVACACGITGNSEEGETCGTNTNNDCSAAGAIACGETICASAWADGGSRDFDWYVYNHPAQANLTVTVTSQLPCIVQIRSSACPGAAVPGSSIGSSTMCGTVVPAVANNLAAGTYRILVTPGTPGGPIVSGFPCGLPDDGNGYAISVSCN